MKICKSCNLNKDLSDFYYNKNKNYYDSKCKICRLNINKFYRFKNKDVVNKHRANVRNTPEGKLLRKSQNLRYKYNITIDEYNKMFLNQNGKCNICNKPNKDKYFAVDHNHKNGKVRGLLCSGCNAKLAWFESYQNNINNHLID